MKTKLMSLLFLAWSGIAMGQTLSIPDVEALPGETVSYSLNINVGEGAYTGYQYQMHFPATGFALTGITTTNASWIGGSLSVGDLVAGAATASALSLSNKTIPTGDIEIGTVEFTVGTGVATGEYDVTISGFDFLDGTNYIHANNGNDVTFKVKVVSVHTVELDELATTAPAAATGVNVRVKRTIKANEWSTICLPFAMTEAQVKTAFGNDVVLKDFNGIESTSEGDDIVGIEVKFNTATAIEANHPYVIKVSSDKSEFTVKDVNISPEDEPSVDKDEWISGSGTKKDPYVYHYNSFVGTYVAETAVPNDCLFLSGNKFWYSNGSTKMKGFRAYFDFYDVLSEVENASARIDFNFDETTGIKEVHGNANVEGTYDLQGRKVEEPTNKGLYIVNGRKVVKK
jgi:hypothetical protein